MIRILHLILLFLAFGMSAQSFEIGRTTITFIDASRGNRSIASEIYYPANSAGINVPVVSTTSESFPVLSFGHGFLMSWDAYQNIWEALVPQGYIMIFPKTEGGASPSHLEFGKDLSFVISQMALLNLNSSSIFYNRISDKSALMGHSMGGGAAFLAVQFSNEIDVILTLAAAETNPSAITAAGNLTIPALVIAGTNDCVTPTNTNQLPMYNVLNSECKTYISITGGNHCQMANYNLFCSIGESTCSPSPTISRTEQHQLLNPSMLYWLDYQLKSNCSAGDSFQQLLTSSVGISSVNNCEYCALNILELNESELFKAYPNPFQNEIRISAFPNQLLKIECYNMHAELVYKEAISAFTRINTEDWASGIYFIKCTDQKHKVSVFKLVK
ncbi:T9SS type A sorting domain-containing protein [Flavobacterium sp.]|jgi:pimeloyl-ACP methyl ester carboxylesterase|uniref:poly(ethylene terephthalate) hydrolase family protein n=1 Tax=Flavobacterium sp. TaxID=239 RepID=UPI0037C0CFB5